MQRLTGRERLLIVFEISTGMKDVEFLSKDGSEACQQVIYK